MTHTDPKPSSRVPLTVMVLAGAAVAITLGVVGSIGGAPRELPVFWFSSVQSLKAWSATVVLALVFAQLATALWMFGRIPGVQTAPSWVPPVHRITGTVAFLLSLPLAFYCLHGFGFDTSTPRTLAHSAAGCLFYGAFTAKMIGIRSRRLPAWGIAVLGGTVFTLFVVLWALSALWWFDAAGFDR
ncbi:DUF6529 family protein [Actinokineospora xionganensis]|uniref:Cytochrome b561 domain-containing protein n=1 Tax=Actinokineospora xionganensis TaxID=2684470 RepID=A0ABR7L445_9PSEU|nr:DUF6529 family protein [Actinokineospora xionganensis]MBC6447342.1 hypothetical protein [Actinokineospora xionganensis]